MSEDMENPHLINPGDVGELDRTVQSSAKAQENSLYSPKIPSSVKNKQTNKTKPKNNKPDWNKTRSVPGIRNTFRLMSISYISTEDRSWQASSGNNLC